MNFADDSSGEISLRDGSVRYWGGSEPSWEMPLEDIAVIGEYTNQSGPVLDDWFLVFVSRSTRHFFLAPYYATGIDQLRSGLSAVLNSPLPTSLANSADFKSVVLWPSQLAGKDLMQFSPVVPSGLIARVTHALLPRVNITLAQAVLSYLAGADT